MSPYKSTPYTDTDTAIQVQVMSEDWRHLLDSRADVLKTKFNITFPLSEALKDFKEAQNKLLTLIGESDSYNIAKRIKTRFPEVFSKPYTPLNYQFRSTCKLRCVRKANSIAYGFFENGGHLGKDKYQPISIETKDCDYDEMLRPWDACEEWIEDILEDKKGLREYYRFMKGPEIKALIKRFLFLFIISLFTTIYTSWHETLLKSGHCAFVW